jgi:cell division transport system permease protein
MTKKEVLMTKLKRVFRTGFFNFWRNGTVSLASVLVMMTTLLVFGLIIFSNSILNASLAELKAKVDVTVTFATSALEEDIVNIKQSLESLPEVSLVTYISREEVLRAFKERHANDQAILQALDELDDNPLGAVLNIRAKDPSQYESVVKFLESGSALSASGVTIIDRINYFQNKAAIDKLARITNAAEKLGFVLTIFFATIAVLITFNTIRLTIYIARDEISVMRLVGASRTYIQGPFVVVGIIYGLVAAFLSLLIFLPATYWLSETTANFFAGFNVFSYYLRHFLEIGGIITISGVFIGALSSVLATRKYLGV